MDKIGDIIREALFFKKQSIDDFAKSIALPPNTVKNVMYKNVRKKEFLEKISAGLGIDLYTMYINSKNPLPSSNNTEIISSIYKRASNIVLEAIDNNNIAYQKDKVETLIVILYEFLLKNMEASDEITDAFCQGMIEHALKNFMMTKKTS
ncbi:hypothetical protein H1Q59_08505 [Holosporaceae bacterium 'Namur']|nr:hypothetical protein [Holosporaceae bacterium 'Namur']